MVNEKMLGQATTTTTETAVATLTPTAATKRNTIKYLFLKNNSGSPSVFTIYHNDSGTTYNNANELFSESLAAGASMRIPLRISVSNTNSNVAVKSSVAGVTATFYGAEIG